MEIFYGRKGYQGRFKVLSYNEILLSMENAIIYGAGEGDQRQIKL